MREAKQLVVRPQLAWGLVITAVVGVISLLVSFQAGMFILLFAVVAWWVWENPEGGLLLFIVLAPILPMMKITQTIGTVTLIKDVIILTMLLRLVLVPLGQKTLPYRRNILWLPIVALAVWTAVETWRADSLILGVLRARDIGLYVALYFAVLYLDHSRDIMLKRFKWLMAGLGVLLVLGVYQWFYVVDSAVLRFDPVRAIWIPRLSSVMAHPSIFGEYLVIMAGLLAAIAVVVRKTAWRVSSVVGLAVLAPFIFLTYSRGVWVGIVAAMGAMAAVEVVRQVGRKTDMARMWKYLVIGFAVMVLVLMGLVRLTPAGVYVRTAIDPTYGSNEERIEFAARLIAPLSNVEAMLGRGLGDVLAQNFREVDLEVYDIASGASRSVQLTKNKTLVDNQYLKTFVEMGLVGLLIYAWIYIRFGKAAFRLKDGTGKIIGLWGIGFLAAFIVQGLFIDIWDIFPTNAYFWIVAALVSGMSIPLRST